MLFDAISVHRKRIPRVLTSAALTTDSIKQRTFRSSVTVMNHTCLDLSAWKLYNKVQGDSYVSFKLACAEVKSNQKILIPLGDGRWRQVMRRCASVADTGVTGVCNWGVYENGVYWEECYCAEDSCNVSSSLPTSVKLITSTLLLMFIMKFLQS